MLGKEEDEGLGWYEVIELGKKEDGRKGLWEEHGVTLVEVPPISVGGGLHPLR